MGILRSRISERGCGHLPPRPQATSVLALSILRPLFSQKFLETSILAPLSGRGFALVETDTILKAGQQVRTWGSSRLDNGPHIPSQRLHIVSHLRSSTLRPLQVVPRVLHVHIDWDPYTHVYANRYMLGVNDSAVTARTLWWLLYNIDRLT
jgi:hypothetical protein